LGTYHTAKKHPQIHSQLSLLVPSVCPFARPPRLAKTINCIPQPKILDPELPQQQQQQKPEHESYKVCNFRSETKGFQLLEMTKYRNEDLKYLYISYKYNGNTNDITGVPSLD
jgi:hypothetical protein